MKQLGTILIIVMLCLSCQKDDHQIENLNGNKISILGHGGMGINSAYPINTLESIIRSLNSGADGVEIDVQMTKDSILVAYHNRNLSAETDMEGEIFSKTWKEIQDARYTTSPYLDYKIASLNSIFNSIKNKNDYLFALDVKVPYHHKEIEKYSLTLARALKQLINDQNINSRVIIESPDTGFINLLIKENVNAKLAFYLRDFDLACQFAEDNSLYGIVTSDDHINKEQVSNAHQKNIRVILFNVDDKEDNREAIRLNPDIIQTDKLKHLVKLLK
ncbi:MAG: hypothetical protein CL840_07365 [Crocinitomicaceae bacterium]|nr:hypothetical protein [Crocinitomicaceae bacterium]|tara:strand:- start:7105 stop:7929 length:825 start_codon:yes stop_codon:yes gene_type:complete